MLLGHARSQDIIKGNHGAVGLVTPGHHNLWGGGVAAGYPIECQNNSQTGAQGTPEAQGGRSPSKKKENLSSFDKSSGFA